MAAGESAGVSVVGTVKGAVESGRNGASGCLPCDTVSKVLLESEMDKLTFFGALYSAPWYFWASEMQDTWLLRGLGVSDTGIAGGGPLTCILVYER